MLTAEQFADLYTFWTSLKQVDLKPSTIQHGVDGLMYTNTKLPAMKGLALLPEVTALLGHGLMRVIASGESMGAVDSTAAIVVVSERAARGDFPKLCKDILESTQCNALRGGGEGYVVKGFDTHFAGEYLHMLKVCALSLVHNYRGPTLGGR